MRNIIFQEILDETPKDVEIFVRLYADIVLRINELMEEKGLNQRSLAIKLEKQPSEIHKWLNGDHNFTLRSLAKLQAELGDTILEVPSKKPVATFQTVLKGNVFEVYTSINTMNTSLEKWTRVSTHKNTLVNAG
jgi:transcriptional regulator with XRE-family HTH domain